MSIEKSKMNNNESPLSQNDEEFLAGAQSYSSVPRASRTPLPKYEDIETRLQNDQCCASSNSRLRRNNSTFNRFSWSHLFSFLPAWMKNASPTGPTGFDSAAESKSKVNVPNQNTTHVQMCHKCTPESLGQQSLNHEFSYRKYPKKSSFERIICIKNFDDTSTIDQRGCCNPMTTGTASSRSCNSKLIQVGIAEVPAHRTKRNACICKQETQKAPEPENSSCQQSLSEKVWEYLQSLISSHRNDCPRCKNKRGNDGRCPNLKLTPPSSPCGSPRPPCQKPEPTCPNYKPPCPNYKPPCPYKPPCLQSKPKPKSSNSGSCCIKRSTDSSLCKESVLELVKEYVKQITSEHKNTCPLCSQQPKCCQPTVPSCLRYMLEQAWDYIKKTCEYNFSNPVPPPPALPPPTVPPCPNPGILKYTTSKSACGCGISKPDSADKKATQKCICASPPLPPMPPKPCRSEMEDTHERRPCCTPCCRHNPPSIQPSQSYNGSHDKSSCLSQSKAKNQSIYSYNDFQTYNDILSYNDLQTNNDLQSNNDLQCYDDPFCKVSFSRCPSASMLEREIIGYRSSTECGRNRKRSNGMQGLSLTMAPKDHKFCTSPNDCKHAKSALENTEKEQVAEDCDETCSGPCNVPKCCDIDTSEQEAQPPVLECSGSCSGRQSQHKTVLRTERDEEAEYEAMLEKKFAEMVAKKLEKAQEVCDEGCDCLTCIATAVTSHRGGSDNQKDPHNYRYYY